MRLVLASASPSRLETLRAAGIEPVVHVSGVDEDDIEPLAPAALAGRLAVLKCAAVVAAGPDGDLVLGCDSVLEIDGEALGKPYDAETATARWQAMRGRVGVLHTGHALHDLATGRTESAVGSTTVRFAEVSDAEIEAYVATGEPLHVAGAFTLEGYAGAFITGIEGDHHNVIGLSLPLLRELVQRLGHEYVALWNR